jgi:hypothetical protein
MLMRLTNLVLQGSKDLGGPRVRVWTDGRDEGFQSYESEGHKPEVARQKTTKGRCIHNKTIGVLKNDVLI